MRQMPYNTPDPYSSDLKIGEKSPEKYEKGILKMNSSFFFMNLPKNLYSHLYYTGVIWVLFKSIKPTRHYLENHEKDIPWHKVVEIILATKNPRKKGDRFEIEQQDHYILFEIRNKTLRIINAKRK